MQCFDESLTQCGLVDASISRHDLKPNFRGNAASSKTTRSHAEVIETSTRASADLRDIDWSARNLGDGFDISNRRRARDLRLERRNIDVDNLLVLHVRIICRHFEVFEFG